MLLSHDCILLRMVKISPIFPMVIFIKVVFLKYLLKCMRTIYINQTDIFQCGLNIITILDKIYKTTK